MLKDKHESMKGKFILTLNNHEKVREWYKDFNIQEAEVMYSV